MRNTLYAAIAACCAMFATSAIIALATAAPPATPAPTNATERELVAHLDSVIATQLAGIKSQLRIPQG